MILSNITVPLLGLVDTAVLGHLEHPRFLGAVAIGGNLFTFVFWAFAFLRMGTTGLVAQAYGKSDWQQLRTTLLQASGLGALIGGLVILTQQTLFPLGLSLMGGSDEVQALALQYCQVRVWGTPATLIQFALIGTCVGLQKPKIALLVLVVTNVLNIALDLLFVVGLDLNVTGVALATVIAEIVGVLLSIVLLLKTLKHHPCVTPLTFKSVINRTQITAFFHVNRDLFIRTCCMIFTFAFFTAQGAQQSDVILAANAVLITFLLLIANALDGFANAAEATIGECIGKKAFTLFHAYTETAGFWCFITALLLTIAFYLGGSWFIGQLTDIEEVAKTAKYYLPWLIAMPLLAFISYLLDGVFIGATKSRQMRDVMLVSLIVFFLPVWYISQPLDNHGLWLALIVFTIARSAMMVLVYRYNNRHEVWY